eukprot:gene6325-10332_t
MKISELVFSKFVFPQILRFFGRDIINIGNSNVGTICYEKKDKQIKNITNLLLKNETSNLWCCNNKEIPVEIFIELPVRSKITKIVLFSQKHSPQEILIEFSKDDVNYKKIIIAKEMKDRVEFEIPIDTNLNPKFIKFKILKGFTKKNNIEDDNNIYLNYIYIFGLPYFKNFSKVFNFLMENNSINHIRSRM